MKEIWKDIEEFPNYKVSNLGRVWNNKSGIIRKPKLKRGYHNYNFGRDNKIYQRAAHRLVAIAFIPTEDRSLLINHKDGNKLNNYVDNLEWCTVEENNLHYKYELSGIHFSPEQVQEIRRKREGGALLKDIAEEYNTVVSTVYNVAKGITYKEVV